MNDDDRCLVCGFGPLQHWPLAPRGDHAYQPVCKPEPVDLRTEYEDYAAGCRRYE